LLGVNPPAGHAVAVIQNSPAESPNPFDRIRVAVDSLMRDAKPARRRSQTMSSCRGHSQAGNPATAPKRNICTIPLMTFDRRRAGGAAEKAQSAFTSSLSQ